MTNEFNFPKFKNKYNKESFTTPEALAKYVAGLSGKEMSKIPENIILIFDHDLEKRLLSKYECKKNEYIGSFSSPVLYEIGENLGFIKISVGAPYAGFQFENLIALGAKNFVIVGLAGGIQEFLKVGDIAIIDKAIRDEGLSYHYEAPSEYAFPCEALTSKIENILKVENVEYYKGITWTTDAIFRETVDEILEYRKNNVLTAEMEDSAPFTW